MRLRLAVLAGFFAMIATAVAAVEAHQWVGITLPLWFMLGIGYYHVKLGDL